jgi:TfoX/Sxy family transcriptional regulator of competence genes
MKMPTPTEADKILFRRTFSDLPGAEVKAMFGNLAAFINGNMFAGLFGSDIGLRLSEVDRVSLSGIAGAGAFGPPDRPMKEYVTVPAAWREASHVDLEAWAERALAYTATLPLKVKKTKKGTRA